MNYKHASIATLLAFMLILSGIVAVNATTDHGSARCPDYNGDGYLSVEEFEQCARDLQNNQSEITVEEFEWMVKDLQAERSANNTTSTA